MLYVNHILRIDVHLLIKCFVVYINILIQQII